MTTSSLNTTWLSLSNMESNTSTGTTKDPLQTTTITDVNFVTDNRTTESTTTDSVDTTFSRRTSSKTVQQKTTTPLETMPATRVARSGPTPTSSVHSASSTNLRNLYTNSHMPLDRSSSKTTNTTVLDPVVAQHSTSTGLIVGLVAGITGCLVIAVVLFVCLRRRSKDQLKRRSVAKQDETNERTTWHNDDGESSEGSSLNIEMQPSHIFKSHGQIFRQGDTLQSISTPGFETTTTHSEDNRFEDENIKETMVFDKKTKSFKLKEPQTNDKPEDGEIERFGAVGQEYTLVRISSTRSKTGTLQRDDYELAKPITDTNGQDDEENKSVNETEDNNIHVQVEEEEPGDGYIEMRLEDPDDSVILMEDDIYANTQFQRSNTLVDKTSAADTLDQLHLPRRAVSEMKRPSCVERAPLPQPRTSLKKANPYDYPPRRSFDTGAVPETPGVKENDLDTSSSDESEPGTSTYNFAAEDQGEIVYDVPPRRPSECSSHSADVE